MRVKIIKAARDTYWYADKIGEVIDVVQCTDYADRWIPTEDNTNGKFITKADCEIVKDTPLPDIDTRKIALDSVAKVWVQDADKVVLEAYLPAIQEELAERNKPKPLTDSEMWDWMKSHLKNVSLEHGCRSATEVTLNLISGSDEAEVRAFQQIIQRLRGNV